jgi:hypothetical protein
MKLTQKRLRSIIQETIEEHSLLSEETMQQAKLRGPIQKFVEHLNMAKQDLGLVVQQTSDKKAMDSASMLLNTITKMIKAVNNMPELTGDPWSDVNRRRD